jgi:hypothetical protein
VLYNRRAQSFGEYVIVIMVIVMAVMALMPMLRRGAQSMIKSGADVIGGQRGAEQDFDSAYLARSTTTTQVGGAVRTTSVNGEMRQEVSETTNTLSRSELFMGSMEE